MDALELQAALVQLDPATTVTPIGPKLIARVPIDIKVDENSVTSQNVQNNGQSDKKALIRKMHEGQNHLSTKISQMAKCSIADVR